QKLIIPDAEDPSTIGGRRDISRRDRSDEIEGGRGHASQGRRSESLRAGERDEVRRDDRHGLAQSQREQGVLRLAHGGEAVNLKLRGHNGKLATTAVSGFERMLRFYPTGAQHPADPRLLALVGIVSDHFGGRALTVVSGFRPFSTKQYTKHSNHNLGRALDF